MNVDDDDSIAVVVAGGGLHLIAATQCVLANQLHRHIRIAWLGEVAEICSANEAAFTLWIEPADGLAVWNYRREWCAWLTALLLILSGALTAAATTTTTALSASALIATAASVVAIVAMPIALMLSLATTASAALVLRTVLRLRL